jgi:hypothetical protein
MLFDEGVAPFWYGSIWAAIVEPIHDPRKMMNVRTIICTAIFLRFHLF